MFIVGDVPGYRLDAGGSYFGRMMRETEYLYVENVKAKGSRVIVGLGAFAETI